MQHITLRIGRVVSLRDSPKEGHKLCLAASTESSFQEFAIEFALAVVLSWHDNKKTRPHESLIPRDRSVANS